MSSSLIDDPTDLAPENSPNEETSTTADSNARFDRGEFVSTDLTEGQFDYVPVPVVAPVSAVLGVLSALALIGLVGIFLAFAAVLVSLWAIWRIRAADGGLGGMKLSVGGLLAGIVFGTTGVGMQAYAYAHEVPEGYERVSFSQDIAKKPFVTVNGVADVHPDVRKLEGEQVFLKGFMYPTGQEKGLTNFLLLKDSGECCFGGQPALTDMIGVVMADGKTADFYQSRVSVAGTFKVNPNYSGESLEPIYILDGEFFTVAKTAF